MRTLVLLTLLTLLLTGLSLRSGSEPPAPAPPAPDTPGFRHLLEELGDEDPAVRGRARAVLVERGEPSVVLLAHCLDAEDDVTREEASAALVEIAPRLRPQISRALTPLLVSRLIRGSHDPDPVVRANCGIVLRLLGRPRVRRPASEGS